MAKLAWDRTGERFYETGVDRGVLYVKQDGEYQTGVAWNGLTGVTESPSGAEASPVYADNIKYLNLMSAEEFGASIEALTYPDEFAKCDGTAELAPGVTVGQQPRSAFGFSYRSRIGNDETPDKGYKIHLVYNALAAPSEKARATVNETPEAMTLSWELTTTPEAIEADGFKPTAHLTINSLTTDETAMAAIEELLYGGSGEGADATLPTPDEILAIINA